MGVTGLWKLLEPSGKPVPLETLENKVLAIDISIWLHQVVKGFQDSKGGSLPNAHLLGLFHRLCKLLFYRVKPVFVFDGGVPSLKHQTIKKRQESKKQFLNSADHLQELLLTALAKEKVVQQVLGENAQLLVKSPKKKIEEEKKPSRDEMFKLPPMEEPLTTTSTDVTFEEKKPTFTLHSIDVNSVGFKALPADKRYEILTDLKETRKQNSWGRLHELPVQSSDFATFQMERLLKRRQVQLSLEEAEKDMGGATLSFSELEKMLTEEGVLAAANKSRGERIANDDVTKFVFVKNIREALEEAKKMESKEQGESSNPPALGMEFDNDLQKAIAMSLDEEPEEEEEEELEGGVKMSEAQKKFLKVAAKSLARTYMMEWGGMSSEDVEELFKESEEIPQYDLELPGEKVPDKGESVQVISSDSDSDFEEVPMEDKESLQVVINPSEIRESLEDDLFSDIFTKDDKEMDAEKPEKVENSSVPDENSSVPDENSSVPDGNSSVPDENSSVPDENSFKEDFKTPEIPEEVKEDKPIQLIADTVQKNTSDDEDDKPKEDPVKLVITPPEDDQLKPTNIAEVKEKEPNQLNILKELKHQKDAITSITLDDLPKETSQASIIEISDTEEEKSPQKIKKSLDDYFTVTQSAQTPKKEKKIEEDVPKVTSPFFVKKSPRSAKKSPGKSSSETEKSSVAKELFPESLQEENREKLIQLKDDLAKETKSLESERNKQERLGVSITEKMSHECKELLRLFGIPYVVAPMEAEAQCAFMNAIQLTDGTITDDSDIWLFGGQTVYKNFFDQRKHVLEYRMEKIEKLFRVDRTKLIQMAMLVGSDYTIGINGIGAVTALEILAQFPTTDATDTDFARLSGLKSFKEWWHGSRHTSSKRSVLKGKLNNIVMTEGFPSVGVLRAYLYPNVDDSQETFVWGSPDVESIREFTKKKFGWPSTRTDDLLTPVLKKLKDRKVQPSIKNYFNVLTPRHTTEMKVSKRVRKAIDYMSGESSAQEPEDAPKKTRKKPEREKAPRKRKSVDDPVPSTSKGPEKVPRIPNTKLKIPQREKDREEAKEKMKKAIEVFRNSK